MTLSALPPKLVASFRRFVRETSGCWWWTSARLTKGYGLVATGRSVERLAHRMSYRLHVGPIPAGLFVLHRCDQRACVNPSHLFLGTARVNTHDAMTKGRLAVGAKHGTRTRPDRIARGERAAGAKMTAASVRALRDRSRGGERTDALAEFFGISGSQVSRIVRRQRWAHVP